MFYFRRTKFDTQIHSKTILIIFSHLMNQPLLSKEPTKIYRFIDREGTDERSYGFSCCKENIP